MLWYFSGYLGYLVLAHYIRTHLTWNRSKRFWTGFVLMIVGAVWTIYSFYIQAIPGITLSTPEIELGWTFCTINCVMLTTGTFLMFSCIQASQTPLFVADISKLTYGMYLIHIFWLGMWVDVFKNDMQLDTVFAIPIISIATYITCYISCKLLSYLPGSKWIIGA